MADPPIPAVPPETIDSYNSAASSAEHLSNTFQQVGNLAEAAKSALGGLQESLQRAGVSLENVSNLTTKQSQIMGIATSVALGAREAFTQMGDIDTSGLNTFGKQIEDLQKILLSGNNAFSDTVEGARKLAETIGNATHMTVPTNVINEGTAAVSKYAMNFLKSADNALKLQNAYIQLSARTGELRGVMNTAGDELTNMNAILTQQQDIMTKTAKATQLPPEEIEKYYAQLGTIPGALSAVVARSGDAGDTTSMLAAAIQLATGSGRKYADVITDLHDAFRMYGATGEDALKFTARTGEIAQKYNIELEDVRKNLKAGAEAFKMYGAAGENSSKMLENAAKIMNEYVGALKSSGLSGAEAANTVQHMTSQLSRLTIAQKGFLSAQTGGPGGLMGAFQIEKMMKEGNVSGVMEKVRATMTRQFGKIVSVEEASTSPQAAAQLTRQMMMLQQGPLGAFAKDDQSALRILEAFKKKAEGKITPEKLGETIVQDTMKDGLKFQQTSATELSNIRQILEAKRAAAGAANLGTVQQSMGARTGTPEFLPNPQAVSREQQRRRNIMQSGSEMGGKNVADWNKIKGTKSGIGSMTGKFQAEAIRGIGDIFKEMEGIFKAPAATLKTMFTTHSAEDQKKIREQESELREQIEGARNQAAMAKNNKDKQRFLRQVAEKENIYKEAEQKGYWAAGGIQSSPSPLTKRREPENVLEAAVRRPMEEGRERPAAGVGRAIPTARKATETTKTAPTTEGTIPTAAKEESQIKGEISVNVTGYCLHCKQKIEGSTQSQALHPTGAPL